MPATLYMWYQEVHIKTKTKPAEKFLLPSRRQCFSRQTKFAVNNKLKIISFFPLSINHVVSLSPALSDAVADTIIAGGLDFGGHAARGEEYRRLKKRWAVRYAVNARWGWRAAGTSDVATMN